MFSKGYYKKIKTRDGFTDFKHHASSWRNSKQLRQQCRRKKMKLTAEDLFRLEEEMYENEEMREWLAMQALDHENAGDRV